MTLMPALFASCSSRRVDLISLAAKEVKAVRALQMVAPRAIIAKVTIFNELTASIFVLGVEVAVKARVSQSFLRDLQLDHVLGTAKATAVPVSNSTILKEVL